VEFVRRGRIYGEPGVDLQLLESHLAFRLPPNFTGRLATDGTFKIFSADRQLSCFHFVHGPGTPLPANWMSAEFTIDGEKLAATGPLGRTRWLHSAFAISLATVALRRAANLMQRL
jgi:hypothetical protein